MKELKLGDLVKVYGVIYEQSESGIHDGDLVAEVIKKYGNTNNYLCKVVSDARLYGPIDVGTEIFLHKNQVQLITKKKVKPITRKQIETAWSLWINDRKANDINDFIKYLERVVQRKIK